ncbi:tryptophan--tRNA ligase [Candidatus Mycoplasma haematohominis]|uniref:tryptophan--tRNA ligase n=1 Tax=Candidatus Mycoplasma haematohominis TaxID=1494318 RepID=UPI001C0A7327|nr:tryptophan--tRNA ligase [Candidatus Mycoplasma haemohominis]
MIGSTKPILLTGIQPTNRLTLGNYLGVIKKIINEQDNYDCYLFAADWHSVTIPLSLQEASYKKIDEYKWNVIRMYAACGLDPTKNKVFIQSEIKEHLELFYFLLTHSTLGELQRMTQYKHLSKQFVLPNGTEMALVGLLTYPVLMAADILMYDTDYVVLGEDQTQHLELTIDLAERINNKYKVNLFKKPKAFNPKGNKAGIKIKDLQNPEIKMSKSSKSYEGVIFLDDDLETIREKIMKAKTDSIGKINIDPINQPGITNLLEIYASLTNISIEEACDRLQSDTYRELKEVVAELVIKEISEIQDRYEQINLEVLKEAIEKNNRHCRAKAREKLAQLKEL